MTMTTKAIATATATTRKVHKDAGNNDNKIAFVVKAGQCVCFIRASVNSWENKNNNEMKIEKGFLPN